MTIFYPGFPFDFFWKHQKIKRFLVLFMGNRKETFEKIGLIYICVNLNGFYFLFSIKLFLNVDVFMIYFLKCLVMNCLLLFLNIFDSISAYLSKHFSKFPLFPCNFSKFYFFSQFSLTNLLYDQHICLGGNILKLLHFINDKINLLWSVELVLNVLVNLKRAL